MGEVYYRMNTVLELYLVAWLLCGTAAALMIGNELDAYITRKPGRTSRVISVSIIILLCLCLIVPPVIVSTIHGPHTPTLDGMAWLSQSHGRMLKLLHFYEHSPVSILSWKQPGMTTSIPHGSHHSPESRRSSDGSSMNICGGGIIRKAGMVSGAIISGPYMKTRTRPSPSWNGTGQICSMSALKSNKNILFRYLPMTFGTLQESRCRGLPAGGWMKPGQSRNYFPWVQNRI